METFIFVHDENIILDYINAKKFSNIKNLKYVFVGNNDVDKIKNLNNVIICKNLPHNLENYPKLTSFTGWYALWKNNLIKSNSINLFEYDVNINDDIEDHINFNFSLGYNVIGYVPILISEHNFIGASPDGLILSQNKDLNGRLIEFKCPISRKFDDNTPVPIYYYHQMQLQMECTNLNECDYVEMQFLKLNYSEWYESNEKYKSWSWVSNIKEKNGFEPLLKTRVPQLKGKFQVNTSTSLHELDYKSKLKIKVSLDSIWFNEKNKTFGILWLIRSIC